MTQPFRPQEPGRTEAWRVAGLARQASEPVIVLRDGVGDHVATFYGPDAARNAAAGSAAPEMVALLRWLDRKGGLGLDVHEHISALLAKVDAR